MESSRPLLAASSPPLGLVAIYPIQHARLGMRVDLVLSGFPPLSASPPCARLRHTLC